MKTVAVNAAVNACESNENINRSPYSMKLVSCKLLFLSVMCGMSRKYVSNVNENILLMIISVMSVILKQ
jgi:hypothetical protein